MFASVFVIILGLCHCSQESRQSQLGRPHLFGPSEAVVKTFVDFHCELLTYPKNESILLQLFKEGNREKVLGEYTALAGEVPSFSFPMIIKPYHEGNLECEAKAQNNSKIQPTISDTHYLKVIEPVQHAELVITSGPAKFFEGRTLELRCRLKEGNHVSYTFLLNGRPISESPHHRVVDNQLLISRTTPADGGRYMCVATNTFNNTLVFRVNSSDVLITVKELVSKPDISFSVLKESFHTYAALVSCWSTRGLPPVHFSLFNGTQLLANTTVGNRNATFLVPLVLGQHLGYLQCQANNGDQVANSEWILLEVVPVSGSVMMHYDYDIGDNYAVIGVRLYCKVTRGTHPQFRWFLNKTLLNDKGSFYYVQHQPPEQSILLLSVGSSIAGTYHCEVSDSFDASTVISSGRRYLDKEVLNRLPVSVVAVVFGSFTFLILLVSICCVLGVVVRRRQRGEQSLLSLEMQKAITSYESDLDVSENEEDADVVNAARGEFDQASEASVDEWPQIQKRRKTFGDEAEMEH